MVASYNELIGKDCCFNCAHYNSSCMNIIGSLCVNGIKSYQTPDFHCGKFRETKKTIDQKKADYRAMSKRCR